MQLPPKVTTRAFARLAEIEAGKSNQALRVAVEGGGCSGVPVRHQAGRAADDDLVLESDGQKVVVDSARCRSCPGATIDFSDELIGARFVIDNPNVSSACGCGTSFSM